MKKQAKGFTLIELLAVIVILAIIALIAIPVIMNIIAKANKSAFKDSAYGIIKAGELYYSEKLLNVEGMQEDISFVFPEATGLDLKGSKPTSGTMIIRKDGKISIAISNGKYCVKKGYGESDITIDENIEDCFIPVLVEELIINGTSITLSSNETKEIEYEIKPLSATNKNLKITSKNENIVSVSEDGKITGVGVGTTTITIETQDGSNIKEEITVTVKPILVNSITFSTKNVTVKEGKSTTVTATINPINATNPKLKWASNGTDIATVKDGVVTGVKVGTTTITVSTEDESEIVETITVTVQAVLLKSSNNCINTTSICPNGTKINVKVNNITNYDFYVIKDTGTELTLIMDRNLGSRVAWITKADYMAAGGTESAYGTYGNNTKGPLTAIKALEERTSGWTNISVYNYTYTDDGGSNRYSGVTRKNIRARLLTYAEATGLGCVYKSNNSCPTYLYENLSSSNTEGEPSGYWFSSSEGASVRYMSYMGRDVRTDVVNESVSGLRPVIKVSKNQ